MLRKMPHHRYSRKSYLPIFDSINLERSSLLRERKNEFNIQQNVRNVGIYFQNKL